MNVIIYPLPFDQWETFESVARRFTETFKEFEPGADYEVLAVCNYGLPTDPVKEMFHGIKTRFIQYYESGCDIGSAQHCIKEVSADDWMICMTSRCYFHKAGWLARYNEAFDAHGDALYGVSASWETGTPHICTRAYAMLAGRFATYPHVIDSRPKGRKFECEEWCLTRWFADQELQCLQVTWDGEQQRPEWRSPANIFRKGDQSNMLVWDRHTKIYNEADGQERERLAILASPP